MNGSTDEQLFSYDYREENVALKDGLFALFQKLQKLRAANADFESVKKALEESTRHSEETDGALIFRFYCFDNYGEAGRELLKYLSPLEPNFARIKAILAKREFSREEEEILSKAFAEACIGAN